MLKKQHRLKKNCAFVQTYKVRNIVSDANVIVYRGRLKTDFAFATKVGFVVTKKFHKRAVKRNRIKRLYREAYRVALKNKQIEKAQKYLSLIFFVKNEAQNLDYKTVLNSVITLMNR